MKQIFVGDFETTVYKGQTSTQVWASALVPLYSEDVKIFHSIDSTLDYLEKLKKSCIVYYHNLKFDGSFWLDYLLTTRGYSQAFAVENPEELQYKFVDKVSQMPKESIKYNISAQGQWYSITIRTKYNKTIEIRDSLKLLPFSVKRIGQSFCTKHKKLEMNYEGARYPGCEITDQERQYIANDVLVIKEALEIMLDEGHNKLTIGACCLSEFKKGYSEYEYDELFPALDEVEIKDYFGSRTTDAYIRKAYRGGWCYLVPAKANREYTRGVTADVNSLYPSMMSSESGNRYPIGTPVFWRGAIPEKAKAKDKYYFVRFKTRFYLKDGYLPFVQVKNSTFYNGNECLTTSDIYFNGKYYSEYVDIDDSIKDTAIILTMTCTDFELFKEHYNLVNLEILDGCYFDTQIGLFDAYMEKYKQIKMQSKGAQRELAKLFLNNLYGKMATNPQSDFKVAYVKENGIIGFINVLDASKKGGYIPIGAAITSYARRFTITAAQRNYHGPDQPGFIYADTDSIHCDLAADQLVGVPVHPTDFCHWKIESGWDYGLFVRQKTYLEHVIEADEKPIEKPYYNIKCAGMPEKCKRLFLYSVTQELPADLSPFSEGEIQFIQHQRTLKDFKIGLKIPGKLTPKRIYGGVLLTETTYEMRE